jgi:glutamate 5-kinase
MFQEIKFGDNDTLSAITSSMIHADYLFLLTDVDGLYTANPRKDTSARLIELVESTAAIRTQGIPLPSRPPPEMYRQLITSIACYSEHGDSWLELRYRRDGNKTDRGRDRYRSRRDDDHHLEPQPCLSLYDSRVPRRDFRSEHRQAGAHDRRTRYLRHPRRRCETLKAWTRHTLTPAGAVVIDSGAHSVLSHRESGGRLLAAGVLSVRGAFASGQAVRVLVRKGAASADSRDMEAAREEYVRGLAPTRPTTPRATAVSPPQGAEPDEMEEPIPDHGLSVEPVVAAEKHEGEWEVEEVGRGLANYNSMQIEKVKGLNRCVYPAVYGTLFLCS